MEENNDVIQDSSPVQEVVEETPAVSEDVKTPTPSAPKSEEVVPRSRLNEELAKRKAAEAELQRLKSQSKGGSVLDVEDYIDISASLDGLDQRQKERLAQEHKLTGRPLKEIRESEDWQMWNAGYLEKVEKEKTLKPSGTQVDSEQPKSLVERLQSARSIQEKEQILQETGLYKSPRINPSKTRIG